MGRRIGIDIDDTLGVFISDFLEFYNDLRGTDFNVEDICTIPIYKILGLTTTEEERAWFDAYDESSRMMAMKPMADSVEVVNRLHQQGDYLIAITGRPEQIKEKTQLWLDREYSRKISELHFKSHGIRKAEMGLGLDIMAEDNGTEALAFAEARAKTYLLDYPWNRKVDSRENLVRVYSWDNFGKIL